MSEIVRHGGLLLLEDLCHLMRRRRESKEVTSGAFDDANVRLCSRRGERFFNRTRVKLDTFVVTL